MPVKTRKIKGYGGKYSVNSRGQVLSNGKPMSARSDKSGYKRVNLKHNGESKTVRVHSLVSRAFLKGRKDQSLVNHKNGDKSDNSLRNLNRMNHSENTYHAHRTGLWGQHTVRQHYRKGKNKVSIVKRHKRKK